MLQRLEAIKDASQRKEVAFRLKVIEFHNPFGTEAHRLTKEEMHKEGATGGNRIYPELQERTSSHRQGEA
ncbi:MAG: hypothetical protein N2327_05405 [Caldimicrobium sp.]|nr:hypothetical protein [Caldimicrobium sp.]MCX7873847.1 hypothetical protein [Caldimicrobium sp.]MDW8094230.1 hypothetical protein [Caldimicrobium sp.]